MATELAEVGVWHWDVATDVCEWSDRCKAHLCLPAGRPPGMNHFYSVIHSDDVCRVRSLVDRSLTDRQDYHALFRVMHGDGTHHWVAALGRARFDDSGKATSMGGVTIDMTRLKQLEQALYESELLTKEQAGELATSQHRFQMLAENATDVVLETDPEGLIRWVTPSIGVRIGRSPQQTVGQAFMHLFHPEDWEAVRTMEHTVDDGTPAEDELRMRIADEGYRWFAVSLRPVFDLQHAVVGRVAGCRDVHREVVAREIATAESQRLRATVAGMLDPLVTLEPVRDLAGQVTDFLFVDANQAACDWIGDDRDRILGGHLLDRFPETVSAGLLRAFTELVDTGRSLILDGFPLTLHATDLRRLDIRGVRLDGLISIIWRDVTDQHSAAARLAASEERFRLLAENSLDVVILVDGNDKVTWVSPAATAVFGWPASECIGRSGVDLMTCDDSRERYLDTRARAAAGQGAVIRVRCRDAAGGSHWAEVHASPFRTPDGHIDGMVASLRIIDVEIQMEQMLERRAHTDELTQLVNRNTFLETLKSVLEDDACDVAVLWCDIDHFKLINDAHGHAAGDTVLRVLGDRLRQSLRTPRDIAARIGGDELMVVLRGVRDADDALRAAEMLRCRVADPIPFAGGTIQATVSVGVALAGVHESVDALLARADEAMYQAKNRGRNRAVVAPQPAPIVAA